MKYFLCWLAEPKLAARRRAKAGGAEGSRTPDLLIANEALYQLSYDPSQFQPFRKRDYYAVLRAEDKFFCRPIK